MDADCRTLKNTPEGSRTPNLLIRSQMLYPIELRVPLSRIANLFIKTLESENTPEGSRTPNLLIRSQMLYPIELRVL